MTFLAMIEGIRTFVTKHQLPVIWSDQPTMKDSFMAGLEPRELGALMNLHYGAINRGYKQDTECQAILHSAERVLNAREPSPLRGTDSRS